MTAPIFSVLAAALRDDASTWTANERLVAIAVGDCMGTTGKAYPSVALIAKRTRLGRRTVQRAMARLTAPGGIFTERTGGSTPDGGRRASAYSLTTRATLAQVPAPQGRRSDPRHTDTRATDDTDPRHSGAVSNNRSAHIVAATATTPSEHVRHSTSEASEDESVREIAPSRRAARVRKAPSGNGAGGWPARFAEEWTKRLGGVVAPGRLGATLGPLVAAHGMEATAAGWGAYLARAAELSRDERRFCSPADFAKRAGDFIPHAKPSPPAPAPEERGPVFAGPRRYS